MKALVAFFSAGGVTAALARRLADAIGAPLYEIRPEVPYTQADLDWRNQQSRSTREMQDKNCRPTLADTNAPVADADVVFVGYPVWWYREPSVIDTFMESANFSGKTVAPFCTSGGSGLGDSAKNIQSLAPGAKVIEGKRFSSSASAGELKNWVEQF